MGNYEWMEVGAEVTLDSDDHRTYDPEALSALADERLHTILDGELREMQDITAQKDTFIDAYLAKE
jgi:hypothetical protein